MPIEFDRNIEIRYQIDQLTCSNKRLTLLKWYHTVTKPHGYEIDKFLGGWNKIGWYGVRHLSEGQLKELLMQLMTSPSLSNR